MKNIDPFDVVETVIGIILLCGLLPSCDKYFDELRERRKALLEKELDDGLARS